MAAAGGGAYLYDQYKKQQCDQSATSSSIIDQNNAFNCGYSGINTNTAACQATKQKLDQYCKCIGYSEWSWGDYNCR